MKIVVSIARILLGLIFVVLPSNVFLHFIPVPPMSGPEGQFFGVTFQTHFMHVIAVIEIVAGLLLLINRYVPLALTVLAGVLLNILLFHLLIARAGLVPFPLLTVALWIIVFWSVRGAFSGIFAARASA